MAKLTTPILLVIEREGQERRIEEFNEHIIKIGKLSSVNLRLDDPNVNRIHAVIEVTTESEAQVIDMGSSKGTRVNGKRIHKARVVSGDQIVLGDTTLGLYIGEAAVQQARLGNFGGGAAEESVPVEATTAGPAPTAPPPVADPTAGLEAEMNAIFEEAGGSESTAISQNPLLQAQLAQQEVVQQVETAPVMPEMPPVVVDPALQQPVAEVPPPQVDDTAQHTAEAAQAVRQAEEEQQQAWAEAQQQQQQYAEHSYQEQQVQQDPYQQQYAQQPEQSYDPNAYQQQVQEDPYQQQVVQQPVAQDPVYQQQVQQDPYQQQYAQQPEPQAPQYAEQPQQQYGDFGQQAPSGYGYAQQPQQDPYQQQAQMAAAAPSAVYGGVQQQPQFTGGFASQGQMQQGYGQQPQQAGFGQTPGYVPAPAPAAAIAPPQPVQLSGQYADSQEVLEVRVLWGDTILDHAHFYEPKQITVGESRKNTFSLSSEALPDNMTSFPLIEAESDRLLVNFTDAMSGEVHLKDQVLSLAQIKQSSKVQRTSDGYQFALPAQSKVRLFVGELVFEISFVPAPKRLPPAVLNQMDHHLARSMGASFLIHGILILMMLFTDESQQTLGEDFLKQPNRFAQLIVRPKEPEKKKKRQESGGAKSKGKEGKMGKKKAPAVNRRAGQKKKNPDGTAPIDMQKTAKAVLEKLSKKGLLGLLPGGGKKSGGIITAKGFGGDDADALGGWHGSKVGAALGGGGLGLKGGGGGGGGFSGSSAGLGRIGTYGRGGGRGGRGWGSSKLRGKRRKAVSVSTGPPAIYGGLDRKIIQRIINQHRSRFKYCYERELIKNPQLQGKIHVWFQIEANGRVYKSRVSRTTMNNDRVEQCLVRRVRVMRFPAPKGGGIVVVNYPFIFRPS